MATTTLSVEERRTTVRQLDKAGHSNRAIARQLGIHHGTVARDLRSTPEPLDDPQPVTSGEPSTPRLMFPLPPQLIQDLNVLHNHQTDELPAPLVRAIHEAANRKRARWITWLQKQAAERPDADDSAPA
ncbi:helix-turn-helix domain-containing protein [Streptomyces sp. WAC01280]|uniref:helix-turn-helix domain-containing protein n=1 Tax=Streptomyces sp. WAC01280 TaxID=2487424 RepID=UPI000F7A47AF|nr:helix-turn-helix domain-containing protein [Streptomyces sp. WAC01280]RSS59563.1 hypothetical protein EF909_06710 [Streptomyces sp. WAC01280]